MKFEAIDRTGHRYGRLVVVERAENDKNGKAMWLCKCDCGKELVIPAVRLSAGKSSCGCLVNNKELIYRRTHRNKLYNQWAGMIYRCTHKNAAHYERYGGRNISVCEEWATDYEAFANWSLENGYEKGLEIDRIDNNKGYSPSNCRWVSHMENSRNRNVRCTSSTGVSGVFKRPDSGKWRATIGVNYKRINLGTFDTFEEAVAARKEAELKYWGKH